MIYLYVPFEPKDGSKLLSYASQWKKYYDDANVPSTVLGDGEQFVDAEKIKVYVLAYESAQGISSSSNSTTQKTISAEELVERLITAGLPAIGKVEIKLCIKNVTMDNALDADSLITCFHKKNYNNCVVRVAYSSEPFPGEESKVAYRNVNGTIPLFFKEGPIDSNQAPEQTVEEPQNSSPL